MNPPLTNVSLLRNTGLNVLGHGIPLIVALVSMPVIVTGLGPSRFGLLALCWTVVGYFNLFDLGLGRAATRRVADQTTRRGLVAVGPITATAVAAQAALGLASGAALFFLAPLIGARLIPDPIVLRGEGVLVLRLLSAGLPAVLVSNGLRAVLEGLRRFDFVNLARAPLGAIIFLIPFVGVLLGWTLPSIVGSIVISRYVAVAVYIIFLRRALGGFELFARARGELVPLLRFGGWVAVSNALIPLVVYLERFVLAARAGPEALGFYIPAQEMVLRLLIVPGAVASVLFPAISGMHAAGAVAAIAERVAHGTKLIVLTLAPVAALLITLGAPALTLWLGAEYGTAASDLLPLFAIALVLSGLAYVPFALAEGRGRPELITQYHAVELPIYAVVLWLLVGARGIEGAALGWMLRTVWTALLFSLLVFGGLGMKLTVCLHAGAGRALIAAGLLISVSYALAALPPAAAALGLAVTLLLFAVVTWRSILDEAQRQQVRELRRWRGLQAAVIKR